MALKCFFASTQCNVKAKLLLKFSALQELCKLLGSDIQNSEVNPTSMSILIKWYLKVS